ncbi:MAG TPA: AAA family ATPase [Phycisphaerae bacterium]|nr:AAA family ATPase [Phycisphaerae bacterium]
MMASTNPNHDNLFGRQERNGVRVVLTGQVGLDKKAFVDRVVRLAAQNGREVVPFHVGDRMYAEAPDVAPGRILDLPKPRLDSLRRSVFKDLLVLANQKENVIVNTHATFRWKHGLFHAYDFDQMKAFDADLYVAFVDNVDAVHERLTRDHDVRHTLKDILVWREEEIVVTEAMAEAVRGYGHALILARANEEDAARTLYRLMFESKRKRVYPSFPMTHVMDMPEVLAEIDTFRDALAEHFITFDPGDLDEKRLLFDAGEATKRGDSKITIEVHGRNIELAVGDVTAVAADIDGQIYARDFKLIDQSDMIVSFVPELPSGKPGLSSGVERELQHAWENTKEVYVVWKPACEPSPFITETATQVFTSVEEALRHFQKKGYIGDFQLDLPQTRTAPRERGRFG